MILCFSAPGCAKDKTAPANIAVHMKSELESEMSAKTDETVATTEVISNTMSFSTESPTAAPTIPPETSALPAVTESTDFTNVTNFTENFTDAITELSENMPDISTTDTGKPYVITPTGKKYHYPTCRLVKTIKQYVTKEEAEAMGYTPCKICKPP